MRGLLLRKLLATTTRSINFSHILKPSTSLISNVIPITQKPTFEFFPQIPRYFSSENGTTDPKPDSGTDLPRTESDLARTESKEEEEEEVVMEDVSNEDYIRMINEYYSKSDNEEGEDDNDDALTDIFEATLRRKLCGDHEDSDDDIMEQIQQSKNDFDVTPEQFEAGLAELSTDDEIEDLYDARDIVVNRMIEGDGGKQSVFLNEMKWDEIVKDVVDSEEMDGMRECEELLEDMLKWDTLLPDEIKMKVETKFDEISERIEKGELEVEEGYNAFKDFEDQMVMECTKMEEEKESQADKDVVGKGKRESDDPPGEGPILRWQTRVVLSPGADSWHPKNRKVKLAVTVKELGLSRHQFLRLRELVGKRYNPGKDELTITSERYEHREENRKDCLRTLFDLIEEAGKATEMVQKARIEDMKMRLRANPAFMQRLQEAKKQKTGTNLPSV